MDPVIELIRGDRRPGLYQVAVNLDPHNLDPQQMASLCQAEGAHFFYLDGQTITNKAEFLTACATALRFPEHFGHNWDALADCLTDLDRVPVDPGAVDPGVVDRPSLYLVLYSQPENFAQADPAEWSVAIEILQSAVDTWQATETPLAVLLPTIAALDGINPL